MSALSSAFALASFLTGETVPRRLRRCNVTWIVASRGQGVNMDNNDVRRPVVGGVGSVASFAGGKTAARCYPTVAP